MFSRITLSILALALCLTSQFLYARIINVPDDFETIQAGIDEAEEGDTVLVQPGVYVENISFEGKDITVASLFLIDRDENNIEETIIDGDQRGSVVEFFERVTDAAMLAGFTIRNGSGTSFGFGQFYGGGIFILQSDVVIDHCIIRDNNVSDEFGPPCGGGIVCYGYIDDTRPTIRDCEIFSNTSEGSGGGISIVAGCNPTIERTIIRNNSAVDGGGVEISGDCNVAIRNCAIIDNLTEGSGGGVFAGIQSIIDLQNVTVAGNSCNRSGGGIWCSNNVQTNAENSIFWGNSPETVFIPGGGDPCAIAIAYCDVEDGEEGIITNDNCDVDWLDGNIDNDPLFADPDEGDFYLTADSPCIDAGDPESDPDPDGTRADMGAFYFHQWGSLVNVPEDFETIQAAIDAVEDGDTVLVQPGTYIENIDFTGKDIIVASLYLTDGDDNYIDDTRIDGNDRGTVVTFSNGETEAAKLVGFAIWNGSAEENGGGINIEGANPEIINCHIIANYAGSRGGGIFISQECGPLIKECIIAGNLSAVRGGGIAVHGHARPVIDRCLFIGNMTEGLDGWYLTAENDSRPVLTNCTMTWAPIFGWTYAIFCSASDLIIVNSIIWGRSPLSISFASEGDPSSLTIACSDILDGRGSINSNDNGSVNWLDGNIDADPLFTDFEHSDFSLTENSPCVDAGTAFFVWEDDTLLNLSPEDYYGEAPDMGAFESNFASAPDPFILHPSSFILYPAYPNPFNSATRILFDLPISSFVNIRLYDIQGREAAVIAEGGMPAGSHSATLNAGNLAAGVYFVRLEAGENVATAKIVSMK